MPNKLHRSPFDSGMQLISFDQLPIHFRHVPACRTKFSRVNKSDCIWQLDHDNLRINWYRCSSHLHHLMRLPAYLRATQRQFQARSLSEPGPLFQCGDAAPCSSVGLQYIVGFRQARQSVPLLPLQVELLFMKSVDLWMLCKLRRL